MCYICTRNKELNTGLWCNGNTTDFGSVILGSSPSRPTSKKPLRNERLSFFYDILISVLIQKKRP